MTILAVERRQRRSSWPLISAGDANLAGTISRCTEGHLLSRLNEGACAKCRMQLKVQEWMMREYLCGVDLAEDNLCDEECEMEVDIAEEVVQATRVPSEIISQGAGAASGPVKSEQAAASKTAAVAAVSACSGELLTSILFFPFELVKSRLQASVQVDNRSSCAYAGLIDGLKAVVRQEGLRGLFAGLPQAAAQSVLNVFISMFTGEFLLSAYRRAGGLNENTMAFPLRLIGGAASPLFALPLETVTARVMTSPVPLTMLAAMRGLWKEGGLRKFWSGLSVSLLLSLNPALMYTITDRLRDGILAFKQRRCQAGDQPREKQQLNWLEALFVGAASKFLTLCVVYPLIRGKVLMQARNTGRAGIFQVLRQIVAQEGFLSLYKGMGAQLSKSILSASLKNAVTEQASRWLES